MKRLLTLLLLSCFATILYAQSPVGAWEMRHTDENGQELRSIVIFAEGYQSLMTYHAETGAFVHTNGGTWTLDGSTMIEQVEYHSDKPEFVGQSFSFDISITDTQLQIAGSDKVFTRLDDGTPGELQGAWLMSARERYGVMQPRDTNLPRKTMKILSGTRFQWIAYNTETKQFMATGGGTYTTVEGKYTEQIEFFSRDNSRVGAKLKFDYDMMSGDWHHSGLSSKGDPLYEVWSIRK